jgi:hypothetical protein
VKKSSEERRFVAHNDAMRERARRLAQTYRIKRSCDAAPDGALWGDVEEAFLAGYAAGSAEARKETVCEYSRMDDAKHGRAVVCAKCFNGTQDAFAKAEDARRPLVEALRKMEHFALEAVPYVHDKEHYFTGLSDVSWRFCEVDFCKRLRDELAALCAAEGEP